MYGVTTSKCQSQIGTRFAYGDCLSSILSSANSFTQALMYLYYLIQAVAAVVFALLLPEPVF